MQNEQKHESYKWDVAISLCNLDAEYGAQLARAINPSLKVFFYALRQEELISKSGPEAFARVFKEESRVVVILSRKEWGESFYTRLEKDAILDRASSNERTFDFLLVFPMQAGEIPIWYPSSRIYGNPTKFSVDELAHFIELKVSEKGGSVQPLTVEQRYQNLVDRLEEKKRVIYLQETEEAIGECMKQIEEVMKAFNEKAKFLMANIFEPVQFKPFTLATAFGAFQMGDYVLVCGINSPDTFYSRIVSTQDISLNFQIHQLFEDGTKKKMNFKQYYFYYNSPLNGWAERYSHGTVSEKEIKALFRSSDLKEYYDLKYPLSSLEVVDVWMQELLNVATDGIAKYI